MKYSLLCLVVVSALLPMSCIQEQAVDVGMALRESGDGPTLNPPYVIGIYPQTPLVHTVGASGQKPFTFKASGLPKRLSIDPQTGTITGTIKKAGTYKVDVTVSNAVGKVKKQIEIVAGDTLSLTPPMAWMTWNLHAGNISEQLIIE